MIYLLYVFYMIYFLYNAGELNKETLRMMAMPRCGVTDDMGNSDRAKRYALHGKYIVLYCYCNDFLIECVDIFSPCV